MSEIHDNAQQQRFELEEDGKLAFADYELEGDVLTIPYVFADPALRGKGTAGRLLDGVRDIARANGWSIRPLCGYAAAYYRKKIE